MGGRGWGTASTLPSPGPVQQWGYVFVGLLGVKKKDLKLNSNLNQL